MANSTEQSRLDRIYEAAVVPEFWPEVIDDLVRLSEAALGSLFAISGGMSRWIGTPAAEKMISDFFALGNQYPNSRIPRGMALRPTGFFTDYDLFTKEEIARDPFYQEFLHPRGYGWVAATEFAVPSGDTLIFSLERQYSRGNFEPAFVDRLNSLRPHIGRAALLAARLDLQRARTMTQALEIVGLPAAVLRTGGAMYAANARFEKLIPEVVRDRSKRLTLVDASADSLFASALSGRENLRTPGQVQSVPVAARGSHPAMIFHLLPVCRAAHDIFARANAIVVVTVVDRHAVPGANVLQGLFDLTPAEARVARGIAERQTVAAMALAFGVSRETIRTQLREVLAKTGLRRQAELANLLAGAQLPG